MAIVKKNSRVSRVERDFSSGSRDSVSSDDGEFRTKSSVSDEDDDFDSGAGSDDFDLSELGAIGTEFCEVANQNCCIPLELYELPDLSSVLSLDAWNDCLTEEERFNLAQYLPDMDQETFMKTLKELFSGSIFHFGSPLAELFDRLKGGLCEPRVALYRQGLNFFQKKEHYHLLRKYQNSMVRNLLQIREAWENCGGYSIEERLRLLNILRSQRVSMCERNVETKWLADMDSSVDEESSEGLVSSIRIKRPNDRYSSVSRSTGQDNRFGTKIGHRSSLTVKPSMEDNRFGTKIGHKSSLTVKPSMEGSFRGRSGRFMTVESTKYGKKNPKGILKIAQKAPSKAYLEPPRFSSSADHSLETKSRPQVSLLTLPRQDQAIGFDLAASRRTRSQIKSVDAEEHAYRTVSQLPKVSSTKLGKKQELLKKHDLEGSRKVTNAIAESEWLGRKRLGEEDSESCIGLQFPTKNSNLDSNNRHRKVHGMMDTEMLTAKPQGDRGFDYRPRDAGKKARYPGKEKRSMFEDQNTGLGTVHGDWDQAFRGTQVEWTAGNQKNTEDEAFLVDDSKFKKKKNWKTGEELQTFKNNLGSDSKVRPSKPFPQLNDFEETAAKGQVSYFHSDHKSKTSLKHFRRKSLENGAMTMEHLRGVSMITQSEETDSDSSEQIDEDAEINPAMRKLGYLSGVLDDCQSVSVRSTDNLKKFNKFARKDKKDYVQLLDGVPHPSLIMGDLGERSQKPDSEIYSTKRKQKGKSDMKHLAGSSEPISLHDYATEILEENNLGASAKLAGDCRQTHKSVKNVHMQRDTGEVLQIPGLKTYSPERKRKGKIDLKYSSEPGKSSYMNDYVDEDLHVRTKLHDGHVRTTNNRPPSSSMNELDQYEGSQMSTKRKRKGKVEGLEESDYLHETAACNLQNQTDDTNVLKKRGKKRADNETASLSLVTSDPVRSERGMIDPEPETKPLRKSPILIKPSVLTGFSFSIIHLLSAVRSAMITVHIEDTPKVHKQLDRSDGKQRSKKEEKKGKLEEVNGVVQSLSHENRSNIFHGAMDLNSSENNGLKNFPSLPFQEIVNRVRLNPGDPCILEMQEPLQDLIRGVLKIFSSKTAPLGAKGWKPLAVYEKPTKSWTWTGPISAGPLDDDSIEEKTSSEAWGVPHKMLVKLVDAFANWLKNGQETLQQIGSLPAPPAMLMLPSLDDKERFRDLRAQKSLTTINPSTDEVRSYFRREEVLRYSVPDRAFPYTAADGRKSVVAPLRRCGGKPTSKARDHFMLKPDRPPHVTILCLVRDAAARLPGSIGTRADVCTLIRDSQYIVEDVSDAQVNQVVSGALDRLHYERDPCVQFDGDRKLWVYLHRDREEEDFEDDGTSSTKKWKRQKKDGTEPSDIGPVTDVGYHGIGDQVVSGSAVGYDFGTDFNVESSVYSGGKTEALYGDVRADREESMEPFIEIPQSVGSAQGRMHQGHPMGWEVLELNPLSRESNIRCQENAASEDFDDETFSRERPVGLLSASLM